MKGGVYELLARSIVLLPIQLNTSTNILSNTPGILRLQPCFLFLYRLAFSLRIRNKSPELACRH